MKNVQSARSDLPAERLPLRSFHDAAVAQLAEQLFCKQQVTGSIPVGGSMEVVQVRLKRDKTPSAPARQTFG